MALWIWSYAITVGDMPAAAKVLLQIGAPWTRTLRPFISAMLRPGLWSKMWRVPPPAKPISITSPLALTSSAIGLSVSASSTLFQCSASPNRKGASMHGHALENLVTVSDVAEQERRVDERRGLRERRHVRGRHDAVVDGDALVHEREIVLLEAQLAVLVQHEVDRLAVV